MVLSMGVYVVGCFTSVDRCNMEGQLVSGVVSGCVCCCQVLYIQILIDVTWKDNL